MAKTIQKKWVCPQCGGGTLAPSRLRKLDVRRYCLDCSQASGLLVERRIPARDARAKAKQQRRIERNREKRARDPVEMRKRELRGDCVQIAAIINYFFRIDYVRRLRSAQRYRAAFKGEQPSVAKPAVSVRYKLGQTGRRVAATADKIDVILGVDHPHSSNGEAAVHALSHCLSSPAPGESILDVRARLGTLFNRSAVRQKYALPLL